jgi:hypothetical protein
MNNITDSSIIYSNYGITWSKKNLSIPLCCNKIQCIQDIWYASVYAFDKGPAFYCWPDNNMTTLPTKCFDKYVDPIPGKTDFGSGVAYDNKKFVTVLYCVKPKSNDIQNFINTSYSNIAPFTWNSIDISDTVGVLDIFYG